MKSIRNANAVKNLVNRLSIISMKQFQISLILGLMLAGCAYTAGAGSSAAPNTSSETVESSPIKSEMLQFSMAELAANQRPASVGECAIYELVSHSRIEILDREWPEFTATLDSGSRHHFFELDEDTIRGQMFTQSAFEQDGAVFRDPHLGGSTYIRNCELTIESKPWFEWGKSDRSYDPRSSDHIPYIHELWFSNVFYSEDWSRAFVFSHMGGDFYKSYIFLLERKNGAWKIQSVQLEAIQ